MKFRRRQLRRVRLHPADDIRGAHSARQRRNTTNIETSRCVLRFFGVELGEAYIRLELGGGLLERRGHHLAGPAPRRPEIDNHGDVAPAHVLVKARVVQLYRVPGEDLLTAPPAFGGRRQTVDRQPIGGIAVGAYNMFQISHDVECWPIGADFKACGC